MTTTQLVIICVTAILITLIWATTKTKPKGGGDSE